MLSSVTCNINTKTLLGSDKSNMVSMIMGHQETNLYLYLKLVH